MLSQMALRHFKGHPRIVCSGLGKWGGWSAGGLLMQALGRCGKHGTFASDRSFQHVQV